MEILEIKKMNKSFEGVRAVRDLSLAVKKGTITSVIGPNGSGKTTLMHLLTGMLPIESGTVAVNGVSLKKIAPWNAAAHGITRTFQEVRLFNQMSVLDNLLLVCPAKNAEVLLRRVQLQEKKNELAGSLSYGQRKLLEIARALAMALSTSSGQAVGIEIFLFDEPFAGLFPEMVRHIVSILQELRADGKTVILIEHNMDLIRELSDHVIVMDGGELLAQGKPNEVLAKKEVLEAYLGQ